MTLISLNASSTVSVGVATVPLDHEDAPMGFIAELQQSKTTKDLYTVNFVDSYKGFAGGLNETLIETANSGSDWNVDKTGGDGYYSYIHFRDAKNGTMGCTACWGLQKDPNYYGDFHLIGYEDPNGGDPIMMRNWSDAFKTTDGGSTWTKTFLPTNFIITSIHFITNDLLMWTNYGNFNHTDADVWRSPDGGKYCERYHVWEYFMDSAIIDANNWWVVGGDGGGVIEHTTNGGSSWNPTTVSDHLGSVFFYDAQTGWVAGDNGLIMSTTDGGATWNKQTSGVSVHLNSTYFTSKNDGWVVGAGGTILYTNDGGATWKPLQSPTTKHLHSVDFPEPNLGWAVGDGGTMVFIHSGSPSPGKLASVKVDPTSATMNVNETKEFTATGLDTSGNSIPGLTFAWSLSQPLGILMHLGANKVSFKATASGTTTLSAETSHNGTSGNGSASIIINPSSSNKAPNVPTTAGPTSGNVGQSLSYDFSASDPDNDQVKYMVDWGDGVNQSTSLGASGWKASIAHSWSAQGKYDIKSKSIDAKGAESSWSTPLTVSISKSSGGGPPTTPTIIGPAQGRPTNEYSFTISSTDPDGNKIMFTIDWGDTKTDTTPYAASGAATTIKHAWASDGDYTVKAKAKDETGLESSWASITVHIATDVSDQPPVITHTPVTQATEGTKVVIQATITDDSAIDIATLFYRKQGATSWSSIPTQGPGPQFSWTIPASVVVKGSLEYYIQAEDDGGYAATSPASGASNPYVTTVKAKGDGGGTAPASKNGDQLLVSLVAIGIIIAVVAIIATLLFRRKGRREQIMPPYYAQQYWTYPQQYEGYPNQEQGSGYRHP